MLFSFSSFLREISGAKEVERNHTKQTEINHKIMNCGVTKTTCYQTLQFIILQQKTTE